MSLFTNKCWSSIPSGTPEKSVIFHDDTPVKHSDNYKIVVVLDESGSMHPVRETICSALNSFIEEQRQVKGRHCSFTLVKFNQNVTRVIQNCDLQEILPLSGSDYQPDGTTALFDAVGDTINWFRYERDVLMVIITDGQENASRQYRKNEVMRMIKEKEDHCGWSYVYLGCDLQTASQGDSIGLRTSAQCSNMCVPQDKYSSFIGTELCTAVKNHRQYGISVQSQLN
jgi:hypothetical protein